MKKVLIVDDEKNIVDIIAFNLKKEGYEVLKAYDGEEGIRKTFTEDPDLILLDINCCLLNVLNLLFCDLFKISPPYIVKQPCTISTGL